MPPIDLAGGPTSGKNRISLLEGAIITWTKQIRRYYHYYHYYHYYYHYYYHHHHHYYYHYLVY
jgi:hypothetical protein